MWARVIATDMEFKECVIKEKCAGLVVNQWTAPDIPLMQD